MTALITLLGILGLAVAAAVTVLLRRAGSRTENTDGLLLERHHRLQARADRTAYSSWSVHNTPYHSRGRRP
ncbi:hypothetical protein NX801_00380 [Streptomyces sp. LP05-1]|uniref:Secreted protein n=1 Tax=Streptomyces pyxinae TaxID=2970734 RepID=A0ABT2C9S2_9ACTN|nr:hypothetical protein [Streptomyces sp. LP05-1]MCS0634145.1 hypothetical protein [Streptomyces sp. LP05-1]